MIGAFVAIFGLITFCASLIMVVYMLEKASRDV